MFYKATDIYEENINKQNKTKQINSQNTIQVNTTHKRQFVTSTARNDVTCQVA